MGADEQPGDEVTAPDTPEAANQKKKPRKAAPKKEPAANGRPRQRRPPAAKGNGRPRSQAAPDEAAEAAPPAAEDPALELPEAPEAPPSAPENGRNAEPESTGPPPEPLDLSQLKEMSIQELNAAALEMGLEDAAGMKKHDLIFRMLHDQARRRGLLFAEGVLEIMPDGYGFLRAPESNYLAGPDDIYVSPSQIRRFACAPETRSAARSGPPRTASATSPSSRSRPSTSIPPRRAGTRSSSTT